MNRYSHHIEGWKKYIYIENYNIPAASSPTINIRVSFPVLNESNNLKSLDISNPMVKFDVVAGKSVYSLSLVGLVNSTCSWNDWLELFSQFYILWDCLSPCNTCLAWVFDSTCLWLIPILPGWQITRHFAPVSLIELKIAQAKLHVFPSVKWWRCNIFVLKCIKTHIFQFFS